MDALVKAKLAQLVATAQVTLIKAERNQHWEGELEQECDKIANLAKDVAAMVRRNK